MRKEYAVSFYRGSLSLLPDFQESLRSPPREPLPPDPSGFFQRKLSTSVSECTYLPTSFYTEATTSCRRFLI